VVRQHCHDIGLATYVVTLDGELFQLVVTLILIWMYLGLEPGLGLVLGLACEGLGLGLGTCWIRYRSVRWSYPTLLLPTMSLHMYTKVHTPPTPMLSITTTVVRLRPGPSPSSCPPTLPSRRGPRSNSQIPH